MADAKFPTFLSLVGSSLNPLLPIFLVIPLLVILIHQVWQSILADYALFLSLGPGGTSPTPSGYCRIKFLSLFAVKDPYAPSKFQVSSPGKLDNLPTRKGPRPIVKGIAPHRQRDQWPSAEMFELLRSEIERTSTMQSRLTLRTSCLEKHGPGLFVSHPPTSPLYAVRCGSEVCHAHPSDGSLHLTLHPADEAKVLAANWGERHPLGGGGWLTRFVPRGFMMVYAPRTEEEVKVVMEIVRSAVWWVGGLDLDVDAEEGQVADDKTEMLGCAI